MAQTGFSSVCANSLSLVRLFATLWTLAHQAPLSLGFPRQEYWSGLPFSSPMHACMLSHFSRVQLFITPWTVAHQAPLSLGFPRQEYWHRLPFPSPGGLPDLEIELVSPVLAGGFFTSEPPGKPIYFSYSSTIHNNQKVETTQVSVNE